MSRRPSSESAGGKDGGKAQETEYNRTVVGQIHDITRDIDADGGFSFPAIRGKDELDLFFRRRDDRDLQKQLLKKERRAKEKLGFVATKFHPLTSNSPEAPLLDRLHLESHFKQVPNPNYAGPDGAEPKLIEVSDESENESSGSDGELWGEKSNKILVRYKMDRYSSLEKEIGGRILSGFQEKIDTNLVRLAEDCLKYVAFATEDCARNVLAKAEVSEAQTWLVLNDKDVQAQWSKSRLRKDLMQGCILRFYDRFQSAKHALLDVETIEKLEMAVTRREEQLALQRDKFHMEICELKEQLYRALCGKDVDFESMGTEGDLYDEAIRSAGGRGDAKVLRLENKFKAELKKIKQRQETKFNEVLNREKIEMQREFERELQKRMFDLKKQLDEIDAEKAALVMTVEMQRLETAAGDDEDDLAIRQSEIALRQKKEAAEKLATENLAQENERLLTLLDEMKHELEKTRIELDRSLRESAAAEVELKEMHKLLEQALDQHAQAQEKLANLTANQGCVEQQSTSVAAPEEASQLEGGEEAGNGEEDVLSRIANKRAAVDNEIQEAISRQQHNMHLRTVERLSVETQTTVTVVEAGTQSDLTSDDLDEYRAQEENIASLKEDQEELEAVLHKMDQEKTTLMGKIALQDQNINSLSSELRVKTDTLEQTVKEFDLAQMRVSTLELEVEKGKELIASSLEKEMESYADSSAASESLRVEVHRLETRLNEANLFNEHQRKQVVQLQELLATTQDQVREAEEANRVRDNFVYIEKNPHDPVGAAPAPAPNAPPAVRNRSVQTTPEMKKEQPLLPNDAIKSLQAKCETYTFVVDKLSRLTMLQPIIDEMLLTHEESVVFAQDKFESFPMGFVDPDVLIILEENVDITGLSNLVGPGDSLEEAIEMLQQERVKYVPSSKWPVDGRVARSRPTSHRYKTDPRYSKGYALFNQSRRDCSALVSQVEEKLTQVLEATGNVGKPREDVAQEPYWVPKRLAHPKRPSTASGAVGRTTGEHLRSLPHATIKKIAHRQQKDESSTVMHIPTNYVPPRKPKSTVFAGGFAAARTAMQSKGNHHN